MPSPKELRSPSAASNGGKVHVAQRAFRNIDAVVIEAALRRPVGGEMLGACKHAIILGKRPALETPCARGGERIRPRYTSSPAPFDMPRPQRASRAMSTIGANVQSMPLALASLGGDPRSPLGQIGLEARRLAHRHREDRADSRGSRPRRRRGGSSAATAAPPPASAAPSRRPAPLKTPVSLPSLGRRPSCASKVRASARRD